MWQVIRGDDLREEEEVGERSPGGLTQVGLTAEAYPNTQTWYLPSKLNYNLALPYLFFPPFPSFPTCSKTRHLLIFALSTSVHHERCFESDVKQYEMYTEHHSSPQIPLLRDNIIFLPYITVLYILYFFPICLGDGYRTPVVCKQASHSLWYIRQAWNGLEEWSQCPFLYRRIDMQFFFFSSLSEVWLCMLSSRARWVVA